MEIEGRGIPREPAKPQDAVETTRAASVDWSELSEVYSRLGSIRAVADHYGVSYKRARAELIRRAVPLNPRGHVKGQKKSQAWRDASAKNWNDPEWREQQRQRWLERLPSMNGPAANSPLEKLLHRALRKAGISFSTQRRMLGRYVVDIRITQKPVIIEADGDTHLRTKARDAERDAHLRAAGYQVFRFTGKPICDDPDGCIRQVIEEAGLTPDTEPVYDIRNGTTGPDNPRWDGGKPEWVCATCGKTFRAYKRNGKPRVTCSRECQVEWQRTSGASTRGRRANSEAMRTLWANPDWRAEQTARIQRARWGDR